jgi:dTDP-4-dehydrorhamnose reductase
MAKPLVVVTGKNGQLGWEIAQLVATEKNEFDFLFAGREELNLARPETIVPFFDLHKPAYFINCAAYTAVDKAETEQEQAYTINAVSVGIIAKQCSLHHCTLISISTDYVFDGNGTIPYQTNMAANPVNYYGYTKWIGEKLALENNPQTIIIRTSWVYSIHGNNFVKTMLRLMKERPEIKVVDDQTGCPTYAANLAAAILQIISSLQNGNKHYGIYQYSNTGVISWFNFATAIRDEAGLHCAVLPIPGSSYPTPAKRPTYSVMDTNVIVKDYGIVLTDWRESLKICLGKMK